MFPCGKAVLESKIRIVRKCEMHKEERDALDETRKTEYCDMEESGTLGSREKTIAILGDRRWPQAAKQRGDKTSNNKKIYMNTWKQSNERPTLGSVSIRSRDGNLSRKGCVVKYQMTKVSSK